MARYIMTGIRVFHCGSAFITSPQSSVYQSVRQLSSVSKKLSLIPSCTTVTLQSWPWEMNSQKTKQDLSPLHLVQQRHRDASTSTPLTFHGPTIRSFPPRFSLSSRYGRACSLHTKSAGLKFKAIIKDLFYSHPATMLVGFGLGGLCSSILTMMYLHEVR